MNHLNSVIIPLSLHHNRLFNAAYSEFFGMQATEGKKWRIKKWLGLFSSSKWLSICVTQICRRDFHSILHVYQNKMQKIPINPSMFVCAKHWHRQTAFVNQENKGNKMKSSDDYDNGVARCWLWVNRLWLNDQHMTSEV